MRVGLKPFRVLFAWSLTAVPLLMAPPGQAVLMLQVPFPPTPVRGHDGVHLVYELHVTNLGPRQIRLTSVEVLGGGGAALVVYEGEVLAENISRPGTSLAGPDRALIDGGMLAVVWLWVTFADPDAVPEVLSHRVTSQHETRNGTLRITTREGGPVTLSEEAGVIGAPLRGGPWLARNISNSSSHRRGGPWGTNGAVTERFAIDYVRLDRFGRESTGDRLRNENYYAFGADVLAVGDAVVVSMHDGVSENVPLVTSSLPPGTPGLGNYVELDLGDGRFAAYGHLQTGSVHVQVGDTVRRGEMIAKVGNSGNSQVPHLHFLLKDARDSGTYGLFTVNPEGLPYVHPTFELVGEAGTPYCKCAGDHCSVLNTETRELEMPLDDLVVGFPDRDRAEESALSLTRSGREALCRVQEGQRYLDQHLLAESIGAYREVEARDPDTRVPASIWARACAVGNVSQQASAVIEACERAVVLEPENGEWYGLRGVARASTGDLAGAVADLERYVAWEPRDVVRAQFGGWIGTLRAGRNPFTPQALEELGARFGVYRRD